MVPLREPFVVFAAAEKETVPSPIPLGAEVIVIQLACVAAVQVHAVEKLNDPDPPPAGSAALDGLSKTLQFAAPWFTVNVWVPAEIVPTRAAEVVFAAAV